MSSENLASSLVNEMPASALLSPELARQVLDKIAASFVEDRDAVYWWQSLKHEAVIYDCSSSQEAAFLIIDEFLKLIPEKRVFIVPTDDNPGPWPVVVTKKDLLAPALKSLPFFEYFISSERCDKLLFDTHHNQLLQLQLTGSGSLPGHL